MMYFKITPHLKNTLTIASNDNHIRQPIKFEGTNLLNNPHDQSELALLIGTRNFASSDVL